MGNRGLQLASLDDAWRFATAVQKSGLAPKQFDSPEKILIAVQSGAEIGLSPMQSLSCICVINGRPSLYGDALPALAWGSGVLEEFKEWIEGDGDEMTAYCYTKRRGQAEGRTTTFSVADAKRAKLWGKSGPWTDYARRMLQMRSRSWNFRDNLSDVLKGVGVHEEVIDVPYERATAAIESKPILNLDDIPEDDAVDVESEPTREPGDEPKAAFDHEAYERELQGQDKI